MSRDQNQIPFFSMNQLADNDSRQRSGKAPRVETSGLLDLRRMAKVYEKQNARDQDQEAIPVPVTVGIGTPPALSLPLALPLPPPPDAEQQRQQAASRNRLLYVMTAMAGVLGLGALALAYVVLTGGFGGKTQAASQQPAAVQAAQPEASATQSMAAAGDKAGADRSGSDQGGDENGDKTGAAGADPGKPGAAAGESEKAVDDDRDEDGARSRKSHRRHRSDRRKRERERDGKPAKTAPAPEQKAPAAAPEDKCMDEIACELAPSPPACCSRYKSNRAGSASLLSHGEQHDSADEDLPKRLERADISQGMSAVLGSVNSCRAGHLAKGTVTVSIKVGSNGKVKSARATSSPSAGLGSCVASKVRKATFPRTQKGATFSYPFVFK